MRRTARPHIRFEIPEESSHPSMRSFVLDQQLFHCKKNKKLHNRFNGLYVARMKINLQENGYHFLVEKTQGVQKVLHSYVKLLCFFNLNLLAIYQFFEATYIISYSSGKNI